jgi:Arc/MetJ-type ribon-helix-helix transcriptional regulator
VVDDRGDTNGMKTTVSIPDEGFEKVERLARRARKSRSEVFNAALRKCVAPHVPEEITESIDDVCDKLGNQSDTFVRAAAQRILEKPSGDLARGVWWADLGATGSAPGFVVRWWSSRATP